MTSANNPKFSIVVGRVSTEDSDRVLQLLQSLARQSANCPHEVILLDRLNDAISTRIRSEYPAAKLVPCSADTSLPQMRADALRLATAPWIIVTEDHCVPNDSWLRDFSRAIQEFPDAVAIAGCVANGVTGRALDWATYLCEYAAFAPPLPTQASPVLAGMNIAYLREALARATATQLTKGFWETTVHPELSARGLQLVQDGRITINHCKKFSFGLFARQRFLYSRYFAGIRFPPGSWSKKLIATAGCTVLPLLLMWRFLRSTGRMPSVRREAWRCSPILFLFFIIWAVGEMVGYVMGPGESLAKIE